MGFKVRQTAGAETGPRYQVVDDENHAVEEASEFLEALEIRGLSHCTVRAYAYDILTLCRWQEESGGKQWRELRASDLLAFAKWQQDNDAEPRSINRRLSTTESLYRFVTGNDLPHGPGMSTPAPYYRGPGRDRVLGIHQLRRKSRLKLRVKVPKKLVEPLTGEQVLLFLRGLRRYRDVSIVYLMLLCGLRSKEVRAVRTKDVFFDESRILIQGKGDKERALPIPDTLIDFLHRYLDLERPAGCKTDSLFVVLQGARRGQPMSESGVRSLFRHHRTTAPLLANANAHRFRHTFGTDMARAGVRLRTLQKMMGHADAVTTLQYINLSMADVAEEFKRAMRTIEDRYRADDRGDDG